uniref:DUF2946 domain-containing protein n=1 Tax=Eiseniibacteriota bacterium TaxID=2212470 RepID=A0A832MMZ7_UNCEI
MRIRLRPLRAPWAAALALALFLGGTNYCLLGAFAGPGSGIGCGMLSGAAAAAAEAPAAPACHAAPAAPAVPACHAAPAPDGADGAPAPAPASRGTLPCCIALAPALAPDGAALSAPDAVIAVLADAVAPVLEAPVARAHAHERPPETGPPARPSRTPLPARAPPSA